MGHPLFRYLGGYIWWIFVKFCKTKIEDEQKMENAARNIFTSIVMIIFIAFVCIKILKI